MMEALMPTPTLWLTRPPAPAVSLALSSISIIVERGVRGEDNSAPERGAGDRAFVHPGRFGHHGLDGEVIEHALPPRLAHPTAALGIGDQHGDRLRQRGAVLRRNEKSRLAPDDHIPMAGDVGGDDRQAR